MKNEKRLTAPTFLTLAETARILRCSPNTVRNRVNAGELKPRFRKGAKLIFSLAEIVGKQ